MKHLDLDMSNPADRARVRRRQKSTCRAALAYPLPTGPTYCLWLPGHTTPLNELMGHPMKRAKLKRRDREFVATWARASRIPTAKMAIHAHALTPDQKRRVSLLVILAPGQRGPDKDCWHKSLCDALVHAGLIVDDSPRWCELGPVEYARGEQAAMIVRLEDV